MTKVSKTRRIFSITFFIVFLPIIAVSFVIVKIVKYCKWKKFINSDKRGRYLIVESDMSKIDIMEGYVFEELLKGIFFYSGYNATLTQKSKDYGADLILVDQENKRIVVQAKRYNNNVGSKSVQEIFSAKQHYVADEAWVVTNSHFSSQAETLAREHDVRLIDREELNEMLASVKVTLMLEKEKKNSANSNQDLMFDSESNINSFNKPNGGLDPDRDYRI